MSECRVCCCSVVAVWGEIPLQGQRAVCEIDAIDFTLAATAEKLLYAARPGPGGQR